MLVAQISDCHVVDRGELFVDRVDSGAALRRTVETINSLPHRPDLVIATGDLVNDGTPDQYDHFDEIVAELDIPFVPLPGNHDDRTELRRRYASVLPAGEPADPLDFVVDLGRLRVIALDTTIPGRHDGRLTAGQLRWLEARLSEAPDRPALIAQHHPPMTSGLRWMDETCGFEGREGEAEVIGRHGNVAGVVTGHLHRAFHQPFAGTVSTTCPSTACQIDLRLDGVEARYSSEPTGFLLHDWRDEVGLTTHVVPTGRFESWSPSWTT